MIYFCTSGDNGLQSQVAVKHRFTVPRYTVSLNLPGLIPFPEWLGNSGFYLVFLEFLVIATVEGLIPPVALRLGWLACFPV